MSVLVSYKPTPEGAEAIRAGAVQAAFHATDLIVHNLLDAPRPVLAVKA